MSGIFALSGQQILYRIVGILVILAAHGYLVALIARLMGDPGPKYDGRLTLNPLNHLEPVGAFVFLWFRFGWIKPVTVDPALLIGRRWGLFVIVLGSLLGILALGAVLWLARPLALTLIPEVVVAVTVIGIFETIARMTIIYVAINLVPIPPLGAGLVLAGFVPTLYKRIVERVYIPAIILGLIIATGVPTTLLAPLIRWMSQIILV